jgi:hypothetical protein
VAANAPLALALLLCLRRACALNEGDEGGAAADRGKGDFRPRVAMPCTHLVLLLNTLAHARHTLDALRAASRNIAQRLNLLSVIATLAPPQATAPATSRLQITTSGSWPCGMDAPCALGVASVASARQARPR